ncbi:hypothetical protein [Cyanobium sp. FACHB-13342]|uniref:hypothetical protein n=1 Tax=Cyanobium sp. FACHB-13342 TaxID=2692793 RepID=UPI00168158F0|nr:hypothetical protein [Cyanobium sp. FACHB-13342]MBD2422694.1 hypothetical protein [Cyanobium sp. FACHB-13342]
MRPLRTHGQLLLLSACSAGLSCTALLGTPLVAPPAAQATTEQKASPYAAPQDETDRKAEAGNAKESPFAGAKESDGATQAALRVDRTKLWWLLLPVGLAVISYGALRSQEGTPH